MSSSQLSSTPSDYAISLIAPTSLSSTLSNQQLENETMYHLIRNDSVQNINSKITGTQYSNLDTSYNCTVNTFQDNEMLTCDISTTSGLHDGTIVVSTHHNESVVENNDVKEFNFGTTECSHLKEFTIDEPSNSIYDSHIQITSEINDGPFGLEGSSTSFEATFRNGGINQEIHKNLNSEYGNTSGIRNMYVIEETTFNTTKALGKEINKYFTLDASYGTRNTVNLPLLNDASTNDIDIIMTNLAEIDINNCGTYRIQQNADLPNVEIYNENGLLPDASVNEIPIHITNNISQNTTLTRLPVDNITPPQWRSIFNRITDITLPEYKFEVNITRNIDNKSGIGFNTDTDNKSNALITLDDSNLAENPYFIKEWADKEGKLTFEPASVTLQNSTNGDALNITNGLISLDTGREGLTHNDHNNNGTIFIQKFAPSNRTHILNEDGVLDSSSIDEALTPAIYYANEYSSFISEENKLNNYIEYTAQMVFKSPFHDKTHFIKNNTSALNLIVGENVVNDNFETSDWKLESTNGVDDLNEVWKIISQSRLNSYEALRDSLGSKVQNVSTSAFIQNIKTPVSIGAINAKANIDLKSVSDLSFYNSFTQNGWTLSSSGNNGLLVSSSNAAFAPDVSTFFPLPTQMGELVSGSLASIPFKVEFNPGNLDANGRVKSELVSDFADIVKITWGTPGNLHSLQIPQEKITKIENTSSFVSVDVDPIDYTLIGELANRDILLTKYTSTKRYRIKFDMGLRPFSSLVATSPLYVITSNYYIAKDVYSGDILPLADLSFIVAKTALSVNYTQIEELITSTTALSVTSTITSDDVKEFNVKITMQDGDDNLIDISQTNPLSSFYAKNSTIFNLISEFDKNTTESDISLLLQYQYLNTNADETVVIFNDYNGYSINFKNDYKNNFSLYSWSSQVNSIGDNSLIKDNQRYISPSNGFSSLNGHWVPSNLSNYNLNISYAGTNESETVLTIVRKDNNNIVHTITLSNNKAVTVPIYISRSNMFDTWRIIKKVGDNLLNLRNSSERFMSTKYIDSIQATNRFQIENGVQLTKSILTMNTIQTPGKSINFRLLSDNVRISLVTNILTTTQEELSPITWDSSSNTGLQFKFIGNLDSFSKTLTLKYYRGYLGTDSVIQRYIIQREITKMTIEWKNNSPDIGKPTYYKQDNIVSYSKTVETDNKKYVNNILPYDSSSVVITTETPFKDLGLLLLPNFSMLADNDVREYNLYTKGDSITIKIVNPNYTNAPIYPDINKSLKDYLIYSFSGSNYNNTNENLKLFSSKLKIKENLKYSITLMHRRLAIYKDNNYLGNPVLKGEMDPLVNSPPNNWGNEIISGLYSESLAGLNIPGYIIKRRPNTNYDESISFFVVHPPMLRFNIMPYLSCPLTLPIENMIDTTPISASSDTRTNSITSKQFCLPVVDASGSDLGPKYEPFKSSISFTHINGDIVTVTNDNSKFNDVLFYNKEPRVASAFVNSPINNVFKFNVTGSSIKIDFYMGLITDASSSSLLTLYNGFASDLLSLDASASFSNTLIKLSAPTSYRSGAQVSFLQTGTPRYVIPANTIFGINNSTNITFTVPNFFLGQVTNPIKLNLPTGPGTEINLYTRAIIKGYDNGQPKIMLYKYIPTSTVVDWNNFTLSEKSVINCLFSSRMKKTFELPHRTLQQTSIQTFDELLKLIPKSEIVNSTWETDASFNSSVRFTFSSLNIDCIQSTLPKFMSPPNNIGYAKFNVVTRTKALKITDKFGYPLADIDHDGISRVTTLSTGCILLNNVINDIPNDIDDIMKGQVITFLKGKNI
jgi:hypothetical protein